MIVFGAVVTDPARFERHCLPGIGLCAEPDSAIVTTDTAHPARARNEIIEAASTIAGVEALVLLDENVAITDAGFPDVVRSTLAAGADITGAIGGTGGTGLDWFSWSTRIGHISSPWGEVSHERDCGDVDVVDGACMILSPRATSTLRFDAEYPTTRGLDVDLCLQARRAGLTVRVADLPVALHAVGVVDRAPAGIAESIFRRKWGSIETPVGSTAAGNTSGEEPAHPRPAAHPGAVGTRSDASDDTYYGHERPELVALVPRTARRILDVGCGSGALGAAVKRRLPHAEVAGIEFVADRVHQASDRLDVAVQVDLNADVDLPFPEGHFDAMIFGDVLEHLLDPRASLRRLLPYLAPEGVVIASIPNVKHWSVMIPALAHDRWEYTDEGLLDRTHVHLFTLREALAMFASVGLGRTVHADANRIPTDDPHLLDPLVQAAVAYGATADDARELLECYQYLLVARRP